MRPSDAQSASLTIPIHFADTDTINLSDFKEGTLQIYGHTFHSKDICAVTEAMATGGTLSFSLKKLTVEVVE